MEDNGIEEQGMTAMEVPGNNEQQQQEHDIVADHEMGMEDCEDYGYEGDDYRHYGPRGRSGYRYLKNKNNSLFNYL